MEEDYDSSDSEKLYLLQVENKKVYVNDCKLQQHQVGGLRFLFNQFYKKKPGVVINFPPLCGKTVTVALFLKAVQHLLKHPVLILCNDEQATNDWKMHLTRWSTYKQEQIAVDYLNPYVKTIKVFIKKPESLNSYLRRRWSIVIIKEDILSTDVTKLSFETDFRICITSTDVKKDLSALAKFYSWMYPKDKINFNDFITEGCNPREKFKRSVHLDFLIADVVMREYHNLKPFHDTQLPDSSLQLKTELSKTKRKGSHISIKNKDATGTKIKRSKNKISNDDNVLSAQNRNGNTINNNKENNDTKEHEENVNRNEDKSHKSPRLDVETYIREQKPLDINNDIDIDEEESSGQRRNEASSNVSNINEMILHEQSIESLHSEIDIKAEIVDEETLKEINDNKHNAQVNDIIESTEMEDPCSASNLRENVVIKTESDPDDKMNIHINNIANNKIKSDDLDDKISEMQEKAFKKFIGSVLDSIF